MGRDSESNEQMIVKANRLVQAKMPLSKLEHRVVGALISQLEKEDEEFDHQKLHIKDLMEDSRVSSQNFYSLAEDICESLLEAKIEVKRKEDGQRVYKGISLMNSCEYKEGDGYIKARFNDGMKPYLLQLKKRFTMYEAGHFLPLRSTYSMRIFELLKMREDISILRMTVEELRDILGVTDKYEYFSRLEHHVIEKAQDEIEEKTDIHFTYDVEREGRSAKRIKFFIHSNEQGPDTPTKMEDRTEAPDIDVINMFLSDLSQEEIENLGQETLDSLHEKALKKAQRENSGRSKNVIQAETYRHMKALWEKR